MAFSLGLIWDGVRQIVSRPAPQPLVLIDGGPNAPELAMRPAEFSPDAYMRLGRVRGEVKMDGICCLHIDGMLRTLEGQPFDAALHCLAALQDLEQRFGEPMFFHSEYCEPGGFDATLKAFAKREGTGTLWVHDALPMRLWRTNQPGEPYVVRKSLLRELSKGIKDPFLGVLDDWPLDTLEDVQRRFQEVQVHGLEGLVLKAADAGYSRTRSGLWLKMKPLLTLDLPLIDVIGSDKAGARKLICKDVGGPVTLTSGMNAEQRRILWKGRDVLSGEGIGRPVLVEVECNGRTEQGKLRHAKFKRLRMDRRPLDEGMD